MSTLRPPAVPSLFDERARPDFPAVFRSLAAGAREIDVALVRIRLSGVRIGPAELSGVGRVGLLLAELNALTLTREAEALLVRPARRRTLRFLLELLREGRIEIRCSPLGGWSPDFSVFHGPDAPRAALVGPHWFERPFSRPGPALAALHGPVAARALSRRFREMWREAHDVADAVRGIMETADARVPAAPRDARTPGMEEFDEEAEVSRDPGGGKAGGASRPGTGSAPAG